MDTTSLRPGQPVLYLDRYAEGGPAWVPATYRGPYTHRGASPDEAVIRREPVTPPRPYGDDLAVPAGDLALTVPA